MNLDKAKCLHYIMLERALGRARNGLNQATSYSGLVTLRIADAKEINIARSVTG